MSKLLFSLFVFTSLFSHNLYALEELSIRKNISNDIKNKIDRQDKNAVTNSSLDTAIEPKDECHGPKRKKPASNGNSSAPVKYGQCWF